jgi:hypothetical protein
MISKCANPDCAAPFDFHEGRLFLFHLRHAANQTPHNSHSVRHFWLCQLCSETYTLIDASEGILISPRRSRPAREKVFQHISAACVTGEDVGSAPLQSPLVP